MTAALWLMAVQGVIGAFDTVYYHEWRARLPARGANAAAELKLHACRDFLYALIFGTLPWLAWQGLWIIVLLAVFVAEIVLTMADFLVEIRVRKPIGDVYGGERLTHAAMGIVFHHGRHMFISHALAGGRTLAELRAAAGHSNVAITSGYLHVIVDEDEVVGELFN